MIIIDARAISKKKPGEINDMISGDLPSRIIVAGADCLSEEVRSSLEEAGASLVDHKHPFVVMASAMKRYGDDIKRAFTEDPLTFSFFSKARPDFKIESAESGRVFSKRDVEKELGVTPEKVIDLFYIIGDKTSNIPTWLHTNRETAASWLRYTKSIKNLIRDEHSPAKSHPLFGRRLEKAESLLENRRSLKKSIQEYKFDHEPDRLVENIQVDKGDDFTKKSEDSSFSIDKLKRIIGKAKGEEPLAIFVKETKNLSFLSGKSDRLEAVISLPSGESCVINQSLSDQENSNAWGLISEAIKNDVTICTNDGKSIYKAAFFSPTGKLRHSEMKSVHDVSVMAFALDNRNLKSSIIKLHEAYSTHTVNDPAKALTILFGRLQYHFSKPGCEMNFKAYKEIEQPLVPVLARMEVKGLPINKKKLLDFGISLRKQRNRVLFDMKEMTFSGFSPDESADVAKMLFEKLKLPVIERTLKGKASTRDDVLEKLKDRHAFVPLLREYRKINWMMNNAVATFESHRNPYSSKIHSKFEQCTSKNGRIQSVEPNTQGIPSKSILSHELKEAFSPENSELFVTMDYKQAEAYMLASLSGDSKLQNVFLSGEDIHRATAAEIFECNLSDVTEKQRDQAKAINFGIVYGMTEHGISAETGLSLAASRKMILRYFDTYPTVKSYLDCIKEGAMETGYVLMANRRKVYIEGAQNTNDKNIRNKALRSAINAPMQGSVSDLIKMAMIGVSNELANNSMKAEICVQVHDELIIQCPKNEVEQVVSLVQEIMTRGSNLAVKPKVDVDIRSSLSSNNTLDIDSIKASLNAVGSEMPEYSRY